MDEQELQATLFSMLPTPAYIFGALLFGIIGFAAYRYGKKMEQTKCKWLGIALMLYPYLTGSDTRWLYATGTVLCAALYIYLNE